MKKKIVVKLDINQFKRKMGEEELKLHLQAKRGCGAHKSKKDYSRKNDKNSLKKAY